MIGAIMKRSNIEILSTEELWVLHEKGRSIVADDDIAIFSNASCAPETSNIKLSLLRNNAEEQRAFSVRKDEPWGPLRRIYAGASRDQPRRRPR